MSPKRSANDPATDPEVDPPYRSLVERVPAIVYVDPVGPEPTAPSYVSPFIETMLGYPPEVATGDGGWWASALHPDDRERVLAEWSRSDASGEPYSGEYRLLAADGRTVWIRDEAVLLRDQEGTPVHWQGVMMDISDAKAATEDLIRALDLERRAADNIRRADEIKTTFLSAVSTPSSRTCSTRSGSPGAWSSPSCRISPSAGSSPCSSGTPRRRRGARPTSTRDR